MKKKQEKVLRSITALALFPALMIGLFSAPALSFAFNGDSGVSTVVEVENDNVASVVNSFSLSADTGDNEADGGDAGASGDSGDSGDNAGDGGNGSAGGDGGDAIAQSGSDLFAQSGFGNDGGNGGEGGNTGNTGNTGNGGNGGMGGQIATGDAAASIAISNEVNHNITDVSVEDDCGCDRYNEHSMSYDEYNEQNSNWWSSDYDDWYINRDDNERGGVNDDEESGSESTMSDSHWHMYSKHYVPVTTMVGVHNQNSSAVVNEGELNADTGDNDADGGTGDNSGDTGESGDNAGNGGNGSAGGDGGDAIAQNGDDANAIALDGGEGGTGASGGNTGNTGRTGDGGEGAEGGLIVTGRADTLAAVVNVANRNVTRIER